MKTKQIRYPDSWQPTLETMAKETGTDVNAVIKEAIYEKIVRLSERGNLHTIIKQMKKKGV